MSDPIWLEEIKLPFYLSYSQLDMFLKCPRQYQENYRQAQRPKRTTNIKAILGSSVHKALECFYDGIKANFGKPSHDVNALIEIFGQEMWRLIQNATADNSMIYFSLANKVHTKEDYERVSKKDQLAAYETGVKCLSLAYKDWYAQDHEWEPVEAEMVIDGPLKDVQDYPGINDTNFKIIIDKVDRHKKTGAYRVVDHKTAAEFDKELIHDSLQLTLYAYAASKALGVNIQHVSYNVFTTSGSPSHNWLHGSRDKKAFDKMLEDLNYIIPAIKLGYWYRTPSEKGCKYCMLRDTCRRT